MTDEKRCDICNKKFSGYGNNPAPLRASICCDECNLKIVMPLRFYESIKEPSNALLFKQDGTITSIKPKDAYFTLKELQALLGGLIELYPKRLHDHLIVCNEEGFLLFMSTFLY
jgi:hypothetical protein